MLDGCINNILTFTQRYGEHKKFYKVDKYKPILLLHQKPLVVDLFQYKLTAVDIILWSMYTNICHDVCYPKGSRDKVCEVCCIARHKYCSRRAGYMSVIVSLLRTKLKNNGIRHPLGWQELQQYSNRSVKNYHTMVWFLFIHLYHISSNEYVNVP